MPENAVPVGFPVSKRIVCVSRNSLREKGLT